MNYFKVNNQDFEVIVTDLEENFSILYSENTGRTLAQGAPMNLDPLGTFFGHKVSVKRKNGYEDDFDALYELLSKPVIDGWDFEIAHLQDSISYKGYVSNGTRKVERVDLKQGKIYWGEFQLNIVPMKAQVLPE